jgi:hypothetical protein
LKKDFSSIVLFAIGRTPWERKLKENSGIKASGVPVRRFQQRTEVMKGLIVAALILGLSAAVRGAWPWC